MLTPIGMKDLHYNKAFIVVYGLVQSYIFLYGDAPILGTLYWAMSKLIPLHSNSTKKCFIC